MTTILITGASRGIGRGLLERFLQLPNHTVIAANRNLASIQELQKLDREQSTRLVIVKLDVATWDASFLAAEELRAQGIHHLDTVIANAGICTVWPKVSDVQKQDISEHMDVNAYGVVALFQAMRPLLLKSKLPSFVVMGTNAGTLNSMPPFPNACYGPSKAVSAWYSIQINREEDWLNSYSLAPGWVRTDLGITGAIGLGIDKSMQDEYMISVDVSCDGMMKVLQDATKMHTGGKLMVYDGTSLSW